MRVVSSRHHAIVREYRALTANPDPDGARLLLDGAHLVREAVAASLPFDSVAVAADRADGHSDEGAMARALEDQGVEGFAVHDQAFRAMSPVREPTGIVAIVRRSPMTPDAVATHHRRFLLVVSDVQDPGNLGALMRVAEAGGVTGLMVCGESANPFSWKAVRGSMGSVLRLPIARTGSVMAALAVIREAGTRTIAAVPRNGVNPDEADWSGSVALVLGGEGRGLDPEVIAACEGHVTIPMTAPVESLNVAVAGAVLIYAARRART